MWKQREKKKEEQDGDWNRKREKDIERENKIARNAITITILFWMFMERNKVHKRTKSIKLNRWRLLMVRLKRISIIAMNWLYSVKVSSYHLGWAACAFFFHLFSIAVIWAYEAHSTSVKHRYILMGRCLCMNWLFESMCSYEIMYGTEQQINHNVLIEIIIVLIQKSTKTTFWLKMWTNSFKQCASDVAVFIHLRLSLNPPPNVQKRLHYTKLLCFRGLIFR